MQIHTYDTPDVKATGVVSPRKTHRIRTAGMVLILSLLLLGGVWRGVWAASTGRPASAITAAPNVQLRRDAPASGHTILPGETLYYQMGLRNRGDPADGWLTFALPSELDMNTVSMTPGGTVVDDQVVWEFTNFQTGFSYDIFTVTAELPVGVAVARTPLDTIVEAYFENQDGSSGDTEVIDDVYVAGFDIFTTIETSVDTPDNPMGEAVAGEIVTATVVMSLPENLVAYSIKPQIFLQDGLRPSAAYPSWIASTTGQGRDLDNLLPRFTYGTWVEFESQATMTGPALMTYTVVATRTQNYFLGGSGEINNNVNLLVQPILRWCEEADCVVNPLGDYNATDTATVLAVRPNINPAITHTYLDDTGIGAGGGQILLTVPNQNQGGAAAYNAVLTATLNADFVYNSADPAPDAVWDESGTTVMTWTLPVINGGDNYPIDILVTFPATFIIGTRFQPLATEVSQETFPGTVPDEGLYTRNATTPLLMPGLIHSKRSHLAPGADILFGEMVTYTIIFTQAENTELPNPYYEDNLPLGFRYIPDTLELDGGAVLADVTVGDGAASGSFIKERLSWTMESLAAMGSVRQIVARYRVQNIGLDRNDNHVWTAATDYTNFRAVPNSAVLRWQPPASVPVSSLPAVNASLDVYQPYLANLSYFKTLRTGATGSVEVGAFVGFRLEFRNTGRAPAYEVKICDQLPVGLFLDTRTAMTYNFSASKLLEIPANGDNLVCWVIDEVPVNQTYRIDYTTEVRNSVMAGVPLVNQVYFENFTSMPGDVPGERHYSEIPSALPTPAHCADPEVGCLTVLGLVVDKDPWQDTAEPGDYVTYTLSYQDTSGSFNYQNVVLTDTFESDLVTFVSATMAPTQQSVGQLVWEVGNLNNASGSIVVTMQLVETLPDGVISLSNVLSWSSAEIPLHTITRTVALQAAYLNLAMSGPENVHADQMIEYTVVYSNVGSADTSPVVLTLDYGPYVDFVSSSPLDPRAGTDNVFDDTVPGTGGNRTLTIQARVKSPLPYALEGPLAASAVIESPGAEAKSDAISMVLDRPVLVFEKIGPSVAPAPGGIAAYTVRVHNQGTYMATNLIITDTWGPNLDYNTSPNQSAGWVLSGDGTYATQFLAMLDVGDPPVEIDFQLIIAETATSYTNTVLLTSDQTTQQIDVEQTWQASIATSKSATPVPVFPGRPMTYTIYYTNTISFGGALNTRITDTLPAGFVYQGQSDDLANGCGSGWTFVEPEAASGGGGDAIWLCPALSGNATGQFVIWGDVLTSAEGSDLVNVTTTSADGIPVRPIEKPLVTRVARPWLRVDKDVFPAHPVAPGDFITYTLTYENYGTDPAYNVVIEDYLPDEVEFVDCFDDCLGAYNNIYWEIPVVPTDTVGTVQVVAQVKAGTGGQVIENYNYTIQSDRLPVAETITGDPVLLDILAPQLSAVKLAEPQIVMASGDRIAYTITLTNDGGGSLTNVMFTDEIDAGTSVDRNTVPDECTVQGVAGVNEVVECQIGTLEQGSAHVVQFEVFITGTPIQGRLYNNIAYRSSDQTALAPSNTTTVCYQECIWPELAWSPESLAASAAQGSMTVQEDVLTVSNKGAIDLIWSIEIVDADNVPWLHIAVDGNQTVILPGLVTAPGADTNVTAYFNPDGLDEGVYTAWLRITSNDPARQVVDIEVTFTITGEQFIYLPLVLKNH